MLTLDGALIGRFWPPERIVAGMRTSRWVRDQLIKGAQKVLLKGRKNGTLGMNVTPADVAQDLMRFEQDSLVRVEIEAAGCWILDTILHGVRKTQLMGWNGAIASLDISENCTGERFRCEWLPEGLRGCNRLSRLSLRDDSITDSSMHRLAPPLSTRTNLTVLNLSHNLICDDGADLLASAISNMSRLFHLDVGSNDIGDEGISSLFEALQNCQSLAMLELSFNDFGSDGLGLLTNTTLTTLDLSGNSIGSQAMERLQPLLSANSSLSHLDLGMCELESHGAEAVAKGLGRATSLRRLELPSNNIGDRGLLFLESLLSSSCRNLVYLDLSDNAIGPRGAAAFANSLPQCPVLSHLDLSNNCLQGGGVAHLAVGIRACQKLTRLDLSQNDVDDMGGKTLLDAVLCCEKVECLELCENDLGDQTASELANRLRRNGNSKLSRVNLCANRITSKGADALAEMLAAWTEFGLPTTLKSLNLENNCLDQVTRACILSSTQTDNAQRLVVLLGSASVCSAEVTYTCIRALRARAVVTLQMVRSTQAAKSRLHEVQGSVVVSTRNFSQ